MGRGWEGLDRGDGEKTGGMVAREGSVPGVGHG